MSLLTGELAFLWASIIALPIAIGITAALMWVYRWSPVQAIVFPGADECRLMEHLVRAHDMMLRKNETLKPPEYQMLAQLGHGLLIRNGLMAVAVSIIFFATFTGAHALLLAL